MRDFNYATGLTMTNHQFDHLFGVPPREPGSQITKREMDIACSIQAATEEIILSQLIHSVRAKYDVVLIDTPAAGDSADAYVIAARAKAGLVARLEALIERIGVARAPMLGIAHNASWP